jgi:tRNA G18 (ribose-2'-O)-methylase SpoU
MEAFFGPFRIVSSYCPNFTGLENGRIMKKSMPELERMSTDAFKEAAKNPLIVVLDQVRSMNNVGSIFRTADSFLIEAIYLCGYTPRPPHRDIQKTALGATETVNWQYFDSTLEAVKQLKSAHYKVVAVEQTHNSISLEDYPFQVGEKTALIFGNEVDGVDDEVLKVCDAVIEIPQAGSKHSLNVTVSAGIVLWDFFKIYLKS